MADNTACVPLGLVAAAASTDKGLGTVDGARQGTTLDAEDHQAAVDGVKEAQDRTAIIDMITDLMDKTGYSGETMSASDAAALDRATDIAMSALEKQAREGIRRRRAVAKSLSDTVGGTTTATAGWWMNLKTKMYSAWASARADMNLWISVLAHEAGLDTSDLRMVQAFEQMPAKARAEEEKYRSRIRALLRAYQRDAENAGMPVEQFAVAIGKYATCLHAEEANAHIVETYRRLIREAEDKYNSLPPAKRTPAEAARVDAVRDQYNARIATHRKYVDSRFEDIPRKDRGAFFCAGYTNADAKVHMAALLDRLKLTEDRAEYLSKLLSNEFDFILSERARLGTLDANEAAKFPKFKHYVPMMASTNSEGMGNLSGNMHDATPYNPGEYHAMMGNKGVEPDSAFVSLGYYAKRAAMEAASKDFGVMLDSLHKKLTAEGVKGHNLMAYDYKEVMRKSQSSNLAERQIYQMLWNRGGFVANIPMEDGSIRRTFFTFNNGEFELNGAKLDGSKLNRALSSDVHMSEPNPIASKFATLTSLTGQMVTRFSPTFAILAGTRDFSERGGNIVNRVYRTENGDRLTGASIVAKFFQNAPRAASIFMRGKRGKLESGSREAQIYQEFLDEGCGQAFAQRTYVKDQKIADLVGKGASPGNAFAEAIGVNAKGAQRALHLIGNVSTDALKTLDGWNDYFQNASAFTHFLTLREAGVSAQEAGAGVLREMNMSQKGTLAPTLQCFAPFVVPTVQSAVAMARSLGFGADSIRDIPKKGWKGIATMAAVFTAYSLLMPLVEDALGEDDAGASRFDAMPLDQVSRFVPIGHGDNGDYVKLPIGYGMPNVAALLAVGGSRVQKGLMSPLDLMFETVYTTVQNMSPGNWPEYGPTENPFGFVMSMVTPAPLQPVMETYANTNRYGSPIAREPMDETQSKADLGRASTPRHDHVAAKYLRDTLGVDMQPEMYRHLENRYLSGPLATLRLLADDMDEMWKGKDMPDSLHALPFPFNALGMSYFLGHQNSAAKTMFFNAERDMDREIRLRGVRLTQPGDSKIPAEEYRRQVLLEAGFDPEWVDDYIAIYVAKKRQRENATNFTKTYKPRWLDGESSDDIKAALQQYEAGDEDIYSTTVRSLNRYRSSGSVL